MIRAAGGVVMREVGGAPAVAVVHRPRWEDWSLPKGKAMDGEPLDRTALREVEEETGFRCELVRRLDLVAAYADHRGREKRVCYWLMRPVEGSFAANEEVDRLEWLDAPTARDRLTHEWDRRILAEVPELVGSAHEPGGVSSG